MPFESPWPYGYSGAQVPGGGIIYYPGLTLWPIPGSNPAEKTVPLSEVLQYLRKTDSTGDEEFVAELAAAMRPYPVWTLAWLDPDNLNNYCTDEETCREYAEMGIDTAPPIIVVPATGDERPYDILDGQHRAWAAALAGRKVLAYRPIPGSNPEPAQNPYYFHGSGVGSVEPRAGRRRKFTVPRPGQHLFLTDDPDAARLYGQDIKAWDLEFDLEDLFELGHASTTRPPAEWLAILGLGDAEDLRQYPELPRHLRDRESRNQYTWYELVNRQADGGQYDAEGERNIINLIKKQYPDYRAIMYTEDFRYRDPQTEKITQRRYDVYIVLDQGILIGQEAPDLKQAIRQGRIDRPPSRDSHHVE